MFRLLKFFLKKLFSSDEYVSGDTIYDDSRYRMTFHSYFELYDNWYDLHREYDYWEYD